VTSARNPIRRSLVPTPANVEGMVEKARGFRVDVLMLDLEDGVPNTDDAKARARSVLGRALEASTFAAREKAIRINGPHTKWFMEDLAFVAGLDIETVVVPMVRDAQDVMVAERALTGFGAPESLGLMLLIETPAAVLNLHDIVKASQRTNGLIAGGLDYASETHALSIIPVGAASRSPLHDQDLLYMRQHVLAVARAYNLSALDAMRPKLISDLEAFRADAEAARWFGFDGVDFYHPSFIDIANDVFTPSEEELAWADRILGANEAVDIARPASRKVAGKVVLPQHIEIARRLKEMSEALLKS
jgi:citrate lyase subunit beta/citryl-CoA lyase